MATIDELMEGKKPGEIKIRGIFWGVFIPYFKAENTWYGICDKGKLRDFCDESEAWELYTEPKKKVKRWLWVSRTSKIVSREMYKECDLENKYWKKIPGTEMEFDE